MGELLSDDQAPSIKLCEAFMIIGASADKLQSKPHSAHLIENKREIQPELISLISSIEPPKDDNPFLSIPSVSAMQLIFPEGSIQFSSKPRYALNYSFTLTDQDRRRSWLHCLKIYEKINPEIVFESSTTETNSSFFRKNKKSISQPAASAEASSPFMQEPASIYVPVVLCLLTKQQHDHAFRQLLEALYDYLFNIKRRCRGLYSLKEAHAVANAEFVRYALFLINDVMCPPKYTDMDILVGEKAIRFPADRWAELPHHEPCITLLMETVDMSKIIDIWMGMLLERQIIIMSKQNYVQFAVCEALRMLIYPLKWSHVFIPVVGDTNCLEAPVPYLMGVNSQLISFDEVVALASAAIVLDLDSGNFNCGKMPRICCKEEARLRTELFAIKMQKYQHIDRARISVPLQTPKLDDEAKGNLFRTAFLNVFFSNLQHYQACIIHDTDKLQYEFTHKNFIMHLATCDNPKCKASKFWTDVVETSLFADFVGDSTTFDESNTANFNMMLDKMYPAEKRHGVEKGSQGYTSEPVTIELKPLYEPKAFFSLLAMTPKMGELDPIPEEEKAISPQERIRYWEQTYELLDKLPYFQSETGLFDMLGPQRPASLPPEARFGRRFGSREQGSGPLDFASVRSEEASDNNDNLIYGTDGLIRFCKFVINTVPHGKLLAINAWSKLEEWLQREIEREAHWQHYILLSYVYEFMGRPEISRLELVLKAYELNEHSLPAYRFTQMLENLGKDNPLMLQSMKPYKGRANDILKKVKDLFIRDFGPDFLSQLPGQSLPSNSGEMTPGGKRLKRRGTMDQFGHKPVDVQNFLVIKPDSLNESMAWSGLARPMTIVIESLMETLISLIESIKSAKPKSLIMKEKRTTLKSLINTSPIMAKLQSDICELQEVRVPPVDPSNIAELLSFFLNLHNLTVVFGIFKKQKFPEKQIDWNEIIGKTYIRLAGSCLSPFLIQTKILKSRIPFTEGRNSQSIFADTGFQDSECPWEFPELDPLINFGLYCPLSFSIPLRIFRPETVLEDLQEAARTYLRDVTLEVGTEYVITVPSLLATKKSDFGNDEGVMQFVVANAPETVSKLLLSKKSATIKYQPRDWSFIIRPEDVIVPIKAQ